jgi:hypothetical protein
VHLRGLLIAAAAFWWTGASAEKSHVELGVLTCTLMGNEEAAAAQAGAEARQTRDAQCSFKAGGGEEETYTARVHGVRLSTDAKVSLIWLVRGETGRPLSAGFLEQSYAADLKTPSDSPAPMVGEVNSYLVLHPMADKPEGSASLPEKAQPASFVITGVELKLKSTSG